MLRSRAAYASVVLLCAALVVAGLPLARGGDVRIEGGLPASPTFTGLTVNGNATVNGKLTVTGVIDPTALLLSGSTDLYLQSADGSTAAVAPLNEGRLRYLNGTGWQASSSTGAWTTLATGTPTLQSVATAGRTYDTAAGAIALTNAVAANTNVLELTKNPAGAQSGNALNVTMGATTTGNAVQVTTTAGAAGNAIAITSAAGVGLAITGTTGSTDAVSVFMQLAASGSAGRFTNNAATAGEILTLTKNPGAAQAGAGVSLSMGANTTGNGLTVTMTAGASGLSALFSGASISCPDGTNAERFGSLSSAPGARASAFGYLSAATGADSWSGGFNSSANSTEATATGSSSAANAGAATAYGYSATANFTSATSVGHLAVAGAVDTLALGQTANASFASSIALGRAATTTTANQAVLGSALYYIDTIRAGRGVTSVIPGTLVIQPTSGTGAGIAGWGMDLSAGVSGDAATASGDVRVRTARTGAGTVLADAVIISGANGSISCPDASANSERFGAGAAVSGTFGTAVGKNSTSGQYGFAGGYGVSNAAYCVGIGLNVVTVTPSIAIGTNASSAANQFVAGSDDTPTSTVYFARGAASATTGTLAFRGTAGVGAGIAGWGVDVSAGVSGDAATASGAVRVRTARAGTGTALSDHTTFNADGTATFTGNVKLNGSTSGTITLSAGATPTSTTYTLPSNFGAAGTALTDAAGNGTLSWTAFVTTATNLWTRTGSVLSPTTAGDTVSIAHTAADATSGLAITMGAATTGNGFRVTNSAAAGAGVVTCTQAGTQSLAILNTAATFVTTTVYPTTQTGGVSRWNVDLLDDVTHAAGVGAGIRLLGFTNGVGGVTPFAGIQGQKTNGTAANTDGYMALLTNTASALAESARLTNTNLTLGSAGFSGLTSYAVNSTPGIEVIATANAFSQVFANTYGAGVFAILGTRAARGTPAAPSAIQSGDVLGRFDFEGYKATTWGGGLCYIQGVASETFTDTATGNYLGFYTTPLSSSAGIERGRFTPSGSLQLANTAAVTAVSAANAVSFRSNAGVAEVSQNGGAYAALATTVSAGWTAAAGTVQVTTSTDGVGVGAAPAATTKLQVTGDATRTDILLVAGAAGTITATGGVGLGGGSNGGSIGITGGLATANFFGGSINATGGRGGPTGEGGALNFVSGGGGVTSGDSGTVQVISGSVIDGRTGSVLLGSNSAATTTAANRDTGPVTIQTGVPTNAGTAGAIIFKPSTVETARVTTTGVQPGAAGTFDLGLAATGWKRLYVDYAINTTSGDSATIHKAAGRFRKDGSGTSFTLTNNLVTANSIVLVTLATGQGTVGNISLDAVPGAGSVVINFSAQPNADCDVNFFVISTD